MTIRAATATMLIFLNICDAPVGSRTAPQQRGSLSIGETSGLCAPNMCVGVLGANSTKVVSDHTLVLDGDDPGDSAERYGEADPNPHGPLSMCGAISVR